MEENKEVLKLQKIDCLVKALGTMVMAERFESDPNQIGKLIFVGPKQVPILEMDTTYRKNALDKLNQIIESL